MSGGGGVIGGVVGGVVGGGKTLLQLWNRASSDVSELSKSDSLGRQSATFDAKFLAVQPQTSPESKESVTNTGR